MVIHCTRVYVYVSITQKTTAQFVGIFLYTHPHQVCTLERYCLPLRYMLCNILTGKVVIGINVAIEFTQPLLTLIGICSLKGYHAEGIHVAHLIDVDGTIYTPAYAVIFYYNISNLQASNVECLAWRQAHRTRCIAHRHERMIHWMHLIHTASMNSVTHEIAVDKLAVNLIGNDEHTMTLAYLAHAMQFFLRPYASCRVMRIAQQEHFHTVIGTCCLKSIQVHLVAVVNPAQYTRLK